MSREDQYNVSVVVDGVNLGTFDGMTGGEITADSTKFRPGGMGKQKSLGGPVQVENVTVSRNYELERDHNLNPFLIGRIGKGDGTIIKQPLDVDGNAFGKPTVWTGKLQRYALPDHDSESTDAGMLELEFDSVSTVTQ